MKKLVFIPLFFLMISSIPAIAETTVALLPFAGENNSRAAMENKFREFLSRNRGISIISGEMMKQILKEHEKAQSLGSTNMDLSSIKTAEYLVSISVDPSNISVKAVDVNSGVDVFNKSVKIEAGPDFLRRLSAEMADSIILHSSSKQRDVPEEAQSYMSLITRLSQSLKQPDELSYPFISIYNKGKYVNPVKDDKVLADKAKLILRIMRPVLVNARVTFVSMETRQPWVYIQAVSIKGGIKTRCRFGIIELENGSYSIGTFEQQ